MNKKITRNLAIASLFLLFLVSAIPWQVSTAAKITGPQEIELTNSITDTFDVGCVRTPWDQYDMFADSDNASYYRVVDHDLTSNTQYTAPTNCDYPLDLEVINGLNPSDPSTNTKWVVKYNNSDKFGSADISIKKFEEALAVGETKVINIDPSSNILDIYMSLAAHTPYIISFTQVGGVAFNVPTFVGANTILDPLGDQIAIGNQWGYVTLTSYATSIFVAGTSGTHLMSIDYSGLGLITAPVSLEITLQAIPETPVTSGVTTSKGDDFMITQMEALSLPSLQFEAFSMDISAGEAYEWELVQELAAIILSFPTYNTIAQFTPNPTIAGYYTLGAVTSGTTTTVQSAMVTASGKIFFIVADVSLIMHHVHMKKYPVVTQAIDTTVAHEIDAFGMKTVTFSIATQSLIWINTTRQCPNSVATVGALQQLLSSGMLTAVGTGSTVRNGTAGGALGTYYVLEPGTYYIRLINTLGTVAATLNIEIKSYNSYINSMDDLWEDSFNGTHWAGFQSATDYNTLNFIQDGREHGSTIAQVIPFTISQMTYINARFNLTVEQNQVFNVSTDNWRVRLQFVLIGPNGYYTTNYKSWYDDGTITWNFDNTSTPSELTLGTMQLMLPGTYKLLIVIDNIWNTTGTDTFYNKNVTINYRILDYSGYYAWIDYQMPTEEPLYHAYYYSADFRAVKFLNFSDPQVEYNYTGNYTYNNESMRGDQYTNGIFLHVTGATPYSWTQILIYLNGTTLGSFTVMYPNGFFDKYFNAFVASDYSLPPTDLRFGQANIGTSNKTYACEFGVFASEYYIFINPGNAPLIIGIEIREYDTPLLQQVNLLAPPSAGVDLTGVTVVIIVVVVVVVAAVAGVVGFILYRRRQL